MQFCNTSKKIMVALCHHVKQDTSNIGILHCIKQVIPHVCVSYQSFLQGGVVGTSPNPLAGGTPLVICPRPVIQFIRSYPPYPRPFFYPQPEDAPCCGDRDPLMRTLVSTVMNLRVPSNAGNVLTSCKPV
jgi:hypothetical protein